MYAIDGGQSDPTPDLIEIGPFRNGWKCFEAPRRRTGVFNQDQAIDYAIGRACFRSGEIRVLDCDGATARSHVPLRSARRIETCNAPVFQNRAVRISAHVAFVIVRLTLKKR